MTEEQHEAISTITVRKRRLNAEDRMAAKALLLSLGQQYLLSGGQLILHFGPGRNPVFCEFQEREDRVTTRLRQISA